MNDKEYLVTEISNVNSKKKFIRLNEESASFQLYNAELIQYRISEGGYISEETYSVIRDKLIKRARERSLHIVARQDITESMLRGKLSDGGYNSDITDITIRFMKEHGFVNDERYAVNYVYCKADTKSRRQIEAYLYSKGISAEIAAKACDEYYSSNEDAESILIKKLIEKKKVDVMSMTYKERSKLMAYLVRKGFGYDSVNRVIDDMRC